MSPRKSPVTVAALLATVTLTLALTTGASQPPTPPKTTLLSTLKVGQSVTLREVGPAWEIGMTDDEAPLTHKVAEIGEDFIVLIGEAGAVETRIPVTAVRAVVHLRTKAE